MECIPTQTGCTPSSTQQIKHIMDLLKRGYEEIQLSQDKDIVLLVGNTGSGKSTLARHIVGNSEDLISQEVEEGTGEFIIVDKKNKISHDSTIVSHTIFPDLIVDMNTGIAYYDCPGFSDTRSGANDISATYFTKKIIDSAKSVKLVFVVNHHSVMKGVDRKDFLLLLKHAIDFIQRTDKFKNSIALVVTKVANNYVRTSGIEALVSDEKVIVGIAKYIEQVRKDILDHPELIMESDQSHDAMERTLSFLDALLFKENDKYLRIGIFRRPNDIGELSGIKLLQSRLKTLQNMINENVYFTEISVDDFGYTISSDSKNHIHDLVEKINNHINHELVAVREEIEEYYSANEKDIFDLDQWEKYFKTLCEMFSQIQELIINDSIEPHEVIMQIIKNIKDMKISISNIHFLKILILEDFIQFIYLVSNETTQKNKSAKLARGVIKILDYFNESQKWYSFLNNFYSKLIQYDLQKKRSEFNTSLLNHITFVPGKTQFNDLNLQSSLTHIIEDSTSIGLMDLSSINISESKLNLLSKILEVTLKSELESFCPTPDKLIIKGHIVKLSDVNIRKCSGELKFIEVLALNKVFIDTSLDLEGMGAQLAIIAPVWEVVGSQRIILDGLPGAGHDPSTPSNQEHWSTRGPNGQPGLPGGPAGSFFGIGKHFINDEFLTISANGGTGGNGQNGGNGSPGLDASDRRYGDISLTSHVTLILYNEKVYEISGQPGGDGGDGGLGGYGGPAGNITIIEVGLNAPQNKVITVNNAGKLGKGGEGGKGGRGGRYGEKEHTNFLLIFNSESRIKDIYKWASNGRNGYSGTNCKDISYPASIAMHHHSHIINNFKIHALDNLSNNVKGSSLRTFISELDDNEQVVSLYSIKGLIEEMEDLECRYYKLKNKLSLIPSYQSILQRIIKYTEKEMSIEETKVLSYLYMAIMSKISTIDNSMNSDLVLDISGFLNLITNKINKLQEAFHEAKVSGLLVEQIESVNDKINEAQNFFVTQVTNEIDIAFNKIDSTMHFLLNEIIAFKSEFKPIDRVSLMRKEKKMENSVVLRVIFDIIKIGSLFFKFLSPMEITLKALNNKVPTILDNFLGYQMNQEKIKPPDDIKHALSEMSAFIKSRPQMFLDQLNNADQILKESPSINSIDNLKGIRDKILRDKKKLEDEIFKGDGYDIAIIGNIRKEIMELLKIEKEKLKTIKDMDVDQSISTLNHIQNIFGVTSDLYSSIKNEKNKIDLVGTLMADKKLRNLQTYEEVLIPFFITLQLELSTIGKQKVDRWKIQSTIKDVKHIMYELTKGFDIEERLMHCIDNLQEGMTTMINVFDLIESYQNEITLYRYLSHINSNKLTEITISDEKLKKAVDNLNFITQSNLILGQYERAVSALKQQVFPFASVYMQHFSLPLMLKVDSNINDLIQNTIMKIEDFKTKILDSAVSLNEYDKYIHTSKHTRFFVWSFDSYRMAISNLLEGKEVFIEADIAKSHINKNAFKFNVIDINFMARNKALQEQLNKDLEDFEVTMTHLGNSYYRCGDKFYIISSEKQIINFTFKRNQAGEPINTNLVYEKIKDNDFMLSPYAMWSIKLTNVGHNLDILHKYKNKAIDLELLGNGQYVDKGINKNICKENLEDYYKVDNTRNQNLDVPISNKLYERGHESLLEDQGSLDTFMTSGASSLNGFSFLNNITHFVYIFIKLFKPVSGLFYRQMFFNRNSNGLKSIKTKHFSNSHLVLHPNDRSFQLTQLSLAYISNDDIHSCIEESHSTMNFQSNLLLWDMVLKKLIGRNTPKNRNKNWTYDERLGFSSDLAYSHYISNNLNRDS